jgi:hypothetical protein
MRHHVVLQVCGELLIEQREHVLAEVSRPWTQCRHANTHPRFVSLLGGRIVLVSFCQGLSHQLQPVLICAYSPWSHLLVTNQKVVVTIGRYTQTYKVQDGPDFTVSVLNEGA